MGLIYSDSKPATFVKVVGLKRGEKDVYLSLFEKKDGAYEKVSDDKNPPYGLSGFLSLVKFGIDKMDLGKGKFEKINTVKFIISDNTDNKTYVLDMNVNNTSISMINALASVDSFGLISFQFYSFETEEGTKKGVSIKNDGGKCEWKYQRQELVDKIENKDEIVKFFEDDVERINALLKGSSAQEIDMINNIIDDIDEEDSSETDTKDDLPF